MTHESLLGKKLFLINSWIIEDKTQGAHVDPLTYSFTHAYMKCLLSGIEVIATNKTDKAIDLIKLMFYWGRHTQRHTYMLNFREW